MDRGYPSRDLIYDFIDRGFYFIMRANKDNFISAIRNVKGNDSVVVDCYNGREIELRVINIELKSNVSETLITNVFDPEFTLGGFKELYHLRWNIETKYGDIKGKLEIENFSGTSELVLLQDFYATMFMTNIVGFALLDANAELDLCDKKQNQKYEHKPNVRMAVAQIRNEFINLFTIDSPRKRGNTFKHIMARLVHNTVPYRPDRSFERKRKHIALKYPMNHKIV